MLRLGILRRHTPLLGIPVAATLAAFHWEISMMVLLLLYVGRLPPKVY